MTFLEPIAGLLVVLVCGGLIFLFSLAPRKRTSYALRKIHAFQQLRRAVGLSVEDGSRLHVSLGKSSLPGQNAASALVGLSTLERVTQLSSLSDRPPVATSGDGGLAVLSQKSQRAAYRAGNALEQYDPNCGYMTGATPFSYIAGTLPVVQGQHVSTNILIGSFGPEVGLLTEAADAQDAFSLAASDSLPAQSVLYATAGEPLIGEELFAVPAYLQAGPVYQASLRAQDVLRWALAVLLLAGAALKLAGVL